MNCFHIYVYLHIYSSLVGTAYKEIDLNLYIYTYIFIHCAHQRWIHAHLSLPAPLPSRSIICLCRQKGRRKRCIISLEDLAQYSAGLEASQHHNSHSSTFSSVGWRDWIIAMGRDIRIPWGHFIKIHTIPRNSYTYRDLNNPQPHLLPSLGITTTEAPGWWLPRLNPSWVPG